MISMASVRGTEMCFSLTSLSSCKAANSKSRKPILCIYSWYVLERNEVEKINVKHFLIYLNSDFIRSLFPENLNTDKKGRPTTASSKIKVRL